MLLGFFVYFTAGIVIGICIAEEIKSSKLSKVIKEDNEIMKSLKLLKKKELSRKEYLSKEYHDEVQKLFKCLGRLELMSKFKNWF